MSQFEAEDIPTELRESSRPESLPREEPQQLYSAPVAWCVLTLSLLLISAWRTSFSNVAANSAQPVAPSFIVDINRAPRSELQALPEVGVALAQRIVLFREERGDYPDVASLTLVHGVGETTLERLRTMLVAGGGTSAAQRIADDDDEEKESHVD